jgi:hypothetical protein
MVDEDEGIYVDPDPSDSTFPASETTPGQVDSRMAYGMLKARYKDIPWWTEYLALRTKGWDWRKAAFIAWSCVPMDKRKPETIDALAQDVLGLRNARTIRKWRENDPNIDLEIERTRVAMLGDHLPDVLEAWVKVAKMVDPAAHRDRITYLETMNVYKPKSALDVELAGKPGQPVQVERVSEFEDWTDDELDWLIANLQAAAGIAGLSAD